MQSKGNWPIDPNSPTAAQRVYKAVVGDKDELSLVAGGVMMPETVMIPLDTVNGRIAARRYAELTGDDFLLNKIEDLDKAAFEAAKEKKGKDI